VYTSTLVLTQLLGRSSRAVQVLFPSGHLVVAFPAYVPAWNGESVAPGQVRDGGGDGGGNVVVLSLVEPLVTSAHSQSSMWQQADSFICNHLSLSLLNTIASQQRGGGPAIESLVANGWLSLCSDPTIEGSYQGRRPGFLALLSNSFLIPISSSSHR